MDVILLVIFFVWGGVNVIETDDWRFLMPGWIVILLFFLIPLTGYFLPPTVTNTIEVVDSYRDLKFPCFAQIQIKSYDYRFSIMNDREERTLIMSCVKVDNND